MAEDFINIKLGPHTLATRDVSAFLFPESLAPSLSNSSSSVYILYKKEDVVEDKELCFLYDVGPKPSMAVCVLLVPALIRNGGGGFVIFSVSYITEPSGLCKLHFYVHNRASSAFAMKGKYGHKV